MHPPDDEQDRTAIYFSGRISRGVQQLLLPIRTGQDQQKIRQVHFAKTEIALIYSPQCPLDPAGPKAGGWSRRKRSSVKQFFASHNLIDAPRRRKRARPSSVAEGKHSFQRSLEKQPGGVSILFMRASSRWLESFRPGRVGAHSRSPRPVLSDVRSVIGPRRGRN